MGQLSVNLVWNGKCAINGVDNVGTVAASLATYLAIQAINPDLVISAGTAGGFKSQVEQEIGEGGRGREGGLTHRRHIIEHNLVPGIGERICTHGRPPYW